MVITSNRRNPFPGLRPFELDEEHLFFGREGQSDDLISRLHRTHFLGVVGTSGSGKSSLVRAGLLPSLYSGFLPGASSSWRIAILRPGSSPMRNLAEELNTSDVFGEASVSEDEAIIQIALTESILRRGSLGLIEVTQQAQMTSDESLLVVVDQFEELFRFKAQAKAAGKQLEAEDEAAAFVKLLLAAVAQREVPIFVVLTMRSDFLGDCAQFRDLPETLNDSQYLIPRLTREQLRRAIEGPVAVGGATMTPRLVNRLLNDTGDNPDQLPILQHALMRTWDYWEDQATPQAPLDLEHYDEIGGMARALSRHADQVYEGFSDSQCEGLKTDRSREIAEVLFKRLTDRGADNREIRRPTRLGEICAVASADLDEVIEVIEAFRGPRRSFLMPPPAVPLHENTMIDISHESLMRNWQRLKAWVDAEAQSATIYRRLAETTAMHEQSKAGFLRDPELTIGLTWRKEQKPNAVWAQRYAPNFEAAIAFLEASNEAARVEAAEKERARKREVNRLRGFLALLGGLSLLTGGAAVYAFNQQQEAQAQTQVAQQQEAAAEEQQQIAEEQRQIAEQEKTNAEEQEKLAITQRETAERAQQDAETQREQAEAASSAEAKQRQQAQVARQRAEEGEAEANRQATIAQEQTAIAEKQTRLAEDNEAAAVAATRTAEIQALNADIQAESFRVENLMASGLNLNALLAAIELGNRIRVEDVGGESVISAVQAKEFDYKSTQEVFNANNSVRSSVSLQAISVLREAYFFEGYREQNTFEGHSDTVEGISFSPDGQMIASGSWDGTIKLWNRRGEELQTLEGHSNYVNKVSFSPDGQTIASASQDGTVKLWNRQGEELQTLEGHVDAVESVSFSPDGQMIVSGSWDGTAKLWNRQGEALQTLSGHSNSVLDVSFSPDGQTIASGSWDGTAKLWNRQGEALQTLEGHTGGVWDVSFSPDGQTIASASRDGTVKLWNRQGEALQTLEGHTGEVYGVSFSPDGQTIASASRDGTVKLWNRQGEELQTLVGHTNTVHDMIFSPDGQTIASASSDGMVKLWNRQGEKPQILEGHVAGVESVSFSPDGQTIASASRDGTVKLWNRQGEALQTLEGHTSVVWDVSFSPDGQTIASASTDGTVKLWNRQGEVLQTLEGHASVVWGVNFSPDGQTIASASRDGTVKLWNRQGEVLQTLEGHTNTVVRVSFSPDGQMIASASRDGTVKLWNRQGEALQTLEGHASVVWDVSFSPDGQMIASASRDGTVKLWNRQGEALQTLEGHSNQVYDVSFSPDGQTIASASEDGTLKLWNRQGEALQTLKGHTNAVVRVSFSPDGQTIASASYDGAVILWNFDLDDLIAKSCGWLRDYMANPNTPEEDKALCQDERLLSSVPPVSQRVNWITAVRAFWRDAVLRSRG